MSKLPLKVQAANGINEKHEEPYRRATFSPQKVPEKDHFSRNNETDAKRKFEQTGLGFSARAELRPGLNSSPCNRQFDFKRICLRRRAEVSARSTGLKFAM